MPVPALWASRSFRRNNLVREVRVVEREGCPPRVFIIPTRAFLIRPFAFSFLVVALAVPLAPVPVKLLSLCVPMAAILLRFHLSIDRERGTLRHGVALGRIRISSIEEPLAGLFLRQSRQRLQVGRDEIVVDLVGGRETTRRLLETGEKDEAERLVRALDPISIRA